MLYVSKARKVSIEKYIFKIMFSEREVTSLKIEIEYMYLGSAEGMEVSFIKKKQVSSTFICLS